jgi:hypothetical protein
VDAFLLERGITDRSGVITDLEGFRAMMREGVEMASPQLLLSTSQMVGIATFVIALGLYFMLRGRADLQVDPSRYPHRAPSEASAGKASD